MLHVSKRHGGRIRKYIQEIWLYSAIKVSIDVYEKVVMIRMKSLRKAGDGWVSEYLAAVGYAGCLQLIGISLRQVQCIGLLSSILVHALSALEFMKRS
jgi:hypothetical protein